MFTPRVFAAIACSLLVACLTVARPLGTAELDRNIYDALARPGTAASNGVAVVAVDESSVALLGQWPWSHDIMARLVDRVSAMGATTIAVDLLWAERDRHPSGKDSSADSALAVALTRAKSVVVANAFLFGDAPANNGCDMHPAALTEQYGAGEPPSGSLFRGSGVVCTLDQLARSASASGFINAAPDPDGLVRRIPLLIAYRDAIYPSLALAAVQRATGDNQIVLTTQIDGTLTASLAGRQFALDSAGRLLLRYRGPAGTFPRVSAATVLDGRAPADMFKGRIVFVGPTAVGLSDFVSTPYDRAFPGVEVHATAAYNLLTGTANRRPPYAEVLELATAVAAVLFGFWSCARFGGLKGGGLVVLATAAAWGGSAILMRLQGAYLSPFFLTFGATVALVADTAIANRREHLRADLSQRSAEASQRLTIQTLSSLTETRNPTTGRHARRTKAYANLLATALAEHPRHASTLTPEHIELVATLAPLHDIGKVGVADQVLNKPAALTPDEVTEMRRHPDLGYEALLNAEAMARVYNDHLFATAKDIVRTHHERWDGSGYPRGLAGTDIPLPGRIVALVDVYDALVSDRPYRSAMSREQAYTIIREGRGTHFDPDVVDAFLKVETEFADLAAHGPLRELPPYGPDTPRHAA